MSTQKDTKSITSYFSAVTTISYFHIMNVPKKNILGAKWRNVEIVLVLIKKSLSHVLDISEKKSSAFGEDWWVGEGGAKDEMGMRLRMEKGRIRSRKREGRGEIGIRGERKEGVEGERRRVARR